MDILQMIPHILKEHEQVENIMDCLQTYPALGS